MTGKQNAIFFLGLTLLIVSFVVSGNWSILWNATFHGPTSGILGQGGGKRPEPIPVPVNGKCPPKWILSNGKCVSAL